MFRLLAALLAFAPFLALSRWSANPSGDDDPDEEDDPPPATGGDFGPERSWWQRRVGRLKKEAARYRRELRDAQAQFAQEREGAVVLKGDEAKALEAYRALGTPEEVAKALKAGEEATGELATVRRSLTIRDAAAAAGFKASVLERLGPDLAYEVRDGKDDEGKPVKVVTVRAGEGQPEALSAYAEREWADFLPALNAEEGKGGQGAGQGAGVVIPPMAGRGQGGGKPGGAGANLAQSYIARAYKPAKQ